MIRVFLTRLTAKAEHFSDFRGCARPEKQESKERSVLEVCPMQETVHDETICFSSGSLQIK